MLFNEANILGVISTVAQTQVESCVCEYEECRTDKSRMTFTLLFGSVSFNAIKQTQTCKYMFHESEKSHMYPYIMRSTHV